MASLCSRSEQCSADITAKLIRAGLSQSDTSAIVAYLRANRFINDPRYARMFARHKVVFAGWGPHKIRLALMAKRIPEPVVAEALAAIDPSELRDAAMKAASSKWRSLNPPPDAPPEEIATARRKVYSFLAGRGFGSDMIRKAIELLSQRGATDRSARSCQ